MACKRLFLPLPMLTDYWYAALPITGNYNFTCGGLRLVII